jgi:hypothetical protein
MEQFLNFVWLLIAVGSFSIAIPGAKRRRAAGEAAAGHPWMAFAAMLCAVALLFPIISVTDDLHFDPQAVEEWAGRRQQLISAHPTHHDSLTAGWGPPALLSAAFALAFEPALLAVIDTAGVPAHVELLAGRANPRSPPEL